MLLCVLVLKALKWLCEPAEILFNQPHLRALEPTCRKLRRPWVVEKCLELLLFLAMVTAFGGSWGSEGMVSAFQNPLLALLPQHRGLFY